MRRSVLALAALCTTLVPAISGAQPGETLPPAPAAAPATIADEKSPGVAFLLSFGVTTAGLITTIAADDERTAMLGVGAMFFGPATGRWYAGETGLTGMGLRALSAGAMLWGLAMILSTEGDCEFVDEPCGDDESPDPGAALMIGGAGLWIGSSIADMIFAERDARRYNERRRVMLTPTRLHNGPPGLALSGTF